MGTRVSPWGVKRPGREADHSPPSSAEVKEWVELYLHSPSTPSWRGAQFKKSQEQLYLYLLHLAMRKSSGVRSRFCSICLENSGQRLEYPVQSNCN
jgi:hypothetical protein